MAFKEIVSQIYLRPWYDSLESPADSQAALLERLLKGYSETQYGRQHGASDTSSMEQYRRNFPPASYHDLAPWIEQVRRGNHAALLPERPEVWVMTRGSTGRAKTIPATAQHLEQVRTCGARAICNFAVRHPDSRILDGKVLNLNFPSVVDAMTVDGKTIPYGYSSGTYARLNPNLNQTSLVPKQEEIDALGPGCSKSDWQARFELAYRSARDTDVRAVMGVTPVIASFARYLRRTHGTQPSTIWDMKALFCTSVPKIQSRYAPRLKSQYGSAPVVEMYTATEGVYAQQIDDLPYVSPNYDTYLLEVAMGSRAKTLYQMKRGEWGSLIISSCLFPRYRIGDLIECMGRQYFRVFGRDRPSTTVEHRIYRALTRWFL